MTKPRSWHLLALFAILALALAIRVAAGFWWQQRLPEDKKFGFPDSQSYWALGQTIAEGKPYQFGTEDKRVFRTPGYPLLLAGLFRISGGESHVLWARALGAVLGVLAVGGVIWLGKLLFDESTALLAGLLAALYPGAVAMSTFVLAEGPFCLLMIGQFICWTIALRGEKINRRILFISLLAGAAAGAATLVRPSWLLFTPAAIFLALLVDKNRKQQAVVGVAMMIGLVVVMLPWWVRNYQVTQRFVPTTLQVGASLYDGLSEQATGASDMSFVAKFQEEQLAADRQATAPLESVYEYRLDRRQRDAAVRWAGENPGGVVRLMGIKFLRIWNVWPNAAELQSWPLRLVVMLGFTPLLIFGLWGAWKYAGRGWPYLLCLLPAVYFTALHMVFVGSIRYRQPAMLVLTVLAAGILKQTFVRRQEVADKS